MEEMPELAQRWQRRIDEAFPHGIITGANSTDHGRTITLPVPRPEVIAMRGLNPVVFLDFAQHDRNLSGAILSWEPVREKPFRVVRVTMDMGSQGAGHDEVMLWSGNLSPEHVAAIQADRTDSLRRSEEGTVWQGRRWDGEP
jgi:hypothetical protein